MTYRAPWMDEVQPQEVKTVPGSWNANPWVWVVEFKRITY